MNRTLCPREDKLSVSAGKTEISEFSEQRLAMDAQNRRRPSEILVMRFEHAEDVVFLQFGQRHPATCLGGGLHGGALNALRQILREDHRVWRQCQGAFDRMIRLHSLRGRSLHEFHLYWAAQLNDTHPSIAVAELMRLLIDEHSMQVTMAVE